MSPLAPLLLLALTTARAAPQEVPVTAHELRSGDAVLRIAAGGGEAPLRLLLGGSVLLDSGEGGPWPVGSGWREEMPAVWDRGRVEAVERLGDAVVLRGAVATAAGRWEVEDAWRARPQGFECRRRWTWRGEALSPPTVLGARWRTPLRGAGAVMPGLLYHGNPAGRRAGEEGWFGLVPQWTGAAGELLLFQEHRFPAPFVSLEGVAPGGATAVAGIHFWPSPLDHAAHDDLWWSLGLEAHEDATELLLLSGPVALNGAAGVVKSGQGSSSPLADAHLRVPPGGVVEKRFLLQAAAAAPGAGFQRALRAAFALHGPYSSAGLPTVEQTVRAKLRFAESRWRGAHPAPGFAMYPHDPDLYVMGWAGQSEAPGYALQVLADRLGRPELRAVARRTLDALAGAPFDEQGFRLALNGRTGEWSRQDPVSQGQAMTAFARAIAVGRAQGADTAAWEAFLRRACEAHAGRLLAEGWRPRSTAEAFLVPGLCLGAELFDEPRFLAAARRAGEHYWERHRAMAEPYWGGTLDAQCEDKEGAWAGFGAFLALHEATGEDSWLEAATHAAEVCLTYTYLWDVDLPPGRLRDHGLRTRGWTSVSVQNMHLDVFGVVYAPELARLGRLTGRPELIELAELMFRSCGQMVDARGSQGEQLQQTRFAQAGDLSDPERFRGGYVEGWTVFWIAAHFLTAAARFEELGELDALWRRP